MLNAKLQSMFEDYKPTNVQTTEVLVSMDPSGMLADLAKCYVTELNRIAGAAGSHILEAVDDVRVKRYLNTLVWMRVNHSNSDRSQGYLKYRKILKRVAVPVVAYQLLVSIGQAVDRDYSIKFAPVVTIEGKELLSLEEMIELSDLFFVLQNSGFKLVSGVPQDVEGELDFMAMCHVEEAVLSYRKSHPVYGFLASFFKQQSLNHTTGLMCRILYGYDSDYRVNLGRLVASIGGSE